MFGLNSRNEDSKAGALLQKGAEEPNTKRMKTDSPPDSLAPALAEGTTRFRVSRAHKQLAVRVERSDKRSVNSPFVPGEDASVDVVVVDAQGKPVRGAEVRKGGEEELAVIIC